MLKKIVVNLIILLVIVISVDFLAGKALQYFYFRKQLGLDQHLTNSIEKAESDVMVFGSSTTFQHYVPGIFENKLKLSFYSAGVDNAGLIVHLAILKAVLARYRPKIIILDFYSSFEQENNELDKLSILLPYYRRHQEIRKIIEQKSPYERIKLLSQIYPFNSKIISIAYSNLNFEIQNSDTQILDNKGYLVVNRKLKIEMDTFCESYTQVPDANLSKNLIEFIRVAKKSNIKVYVIHSPVFPIFKYNSELDNARKICYAENVPFLDFSKDITFQNKKNLFNDPRHLSKAGSEIFSRMVTQRILEDTIGIFTEIAKISKP